MQFLNDFKLSSILGFPVALAEAIAFAMIPGFSLFTGLYAAFVMALITAIFGGRPEMISGATENLYFNNPKFRKTDYR